ncbi:MAG: ABC transporter ATP-binding protein [Rhodospirillales bacterium]|nr:ABC transporter ATP-binding protein [Rhodospirillales bacterium]MDP6642761.1 ABC transporter ATP-binding protein [Rhodospirillales bacterium]MDP6841507.1 ABC transporter ATP-binding protein [Rhodospirillales bacterium]
MALLETHNLVAFYGNFQALYGIDTYVDKGETVAIIGANGAGKSTYLHSVTGLHSDAGDTVRFDGIAIGQLPAAEVVKLGISLVPEGRRLFSSLSVEENLLIGGYGRKGGGYWSLASIFELFPVLKELRNLPVMSLSGGQQQMVAFGRALISNPRMLLCDEVSLGLAPTVIKDIYAVFPAIKESGASIVLVEQDVHRALEVADRVYCFMEGRVTLSGRPRDLDQAMIRSAYFGT